MGKRFASFYRCLAFARFWNVKFWRSFIKCQYFNEGWTDFHKIYIFILGFFRKPEKKLWSHTGSKWWPGDPDVKDDPLTRWPSDPVPCLDSRRRVNAWRPLTWLAKFCFFLYFLSFLILFEIISELTWSRWSSQGAWRTRCTAVLACFS